MKIIVAQRHTENLIGIKDAVRQVDAERAEIIHFTSSSEDVVRHVKDGQPAFIVSGQVFSFGFSGTQLALEVKKVNPLAAFFIYSVVPSKNGAVDGVIPKNEGTAYNHQHSLLARILTLPEEDLTSQKVKTLFREVE
jgi:hypothetical protein